MRQSWVLYELCLFLPIEREIGVELSGFVALIYGLDIYRDGYEGVALDSHEFKVIPVDYRSLTNWDHTNGRLVGVTSNLLTSMTLNS